MPQHIQQLKGKRKITALTAYDYPMAKILSRAGVDILLVGDSLGMVVLGYENTHFVTLDDVIRHGQAVVRGNEKALVVIDMPIGTCDTPDEAVRNCRKVCEETGARTVKIEGLPDSVRAVTESGISVMGHTGLKPQEVPRCKLQGKTRDSQDQIMKEAVALQDAGAFSLILECVPSDFGRKITERLDIPVIGIGSGVDTDGQILVSYDILGMFDDIKPKFVRRYAEIGNDILLASKKFVQDVKKGEYPSKGEWYE